MRTVLCGLAQALTWVNIHRWGHVAADMKAFVGLRSRTPHILNSASCSGIFGHAVEQWLSGCVTSRKVAGSRPDEVNAFFNSPNASGRTRPWGLLSKRPERAADHTSAQHAWSAPSTRPLVQAIPLSFPEHTRVVCARTHNHTPEGMLSFPTADS
jgi:hypothetical protein